MIAKILDWPSHYHRPGRPAGVLAWPCCGLASLARIWSLRPPVTTGVRQPLLGHHTLLSTQGVLHQYSPVFTVHLHSLLSPPPPPHLTLLPRLACSPPEPGEVPERVADVGRGLGAGHRAVELHQLLPRDRVDRGGLAGLQGLQALLQPRADRRPGGGS